MSVNELCSRSWLNPVANVRVCHPLGEREEYRHSLKTSVPR
jgi:hypothetical protein